MSLKGSQTVDDVSVSKGLVIAYPIVDNAVVNAGIDLGYCMETELRIADAVKNRYSPRDGTKKKIYERVVQTDYSIPMTIISENGDNFAILFNGVKGLYVQAGSHYTWVAPETVTAPAVLDRSVQLAQKGVTCKTLKYDGGTGAFTNGDTVTGAGGATGLIAWVDGIVASGSLYLVNVVGDFVDDEAITDGVTGAAVVNGTQVEINDLVLMDAAQTTKYTLDTDYGVHEKSGTVFLYSGVTIAAAASLRAIYDYATISDVVIQESDSAIDHYEVHILPQNCYGKKVEWVFWKCAVYSDTTLKVISESDDDAEMSLTFTPLADGPNQSSEYPYFRQRIYA